MSLADAIAASTPSSNSTVTATTSRKAPAKTGNAAANSDDRPRNNSPAFQAYEDKKKACDSRITDIRARIVKQDI